MRYHFLSLDTCNLIIVQERGHEVSVLDAMNIPFRSCCFDAAISIAVVHHLSNEVRLCFDLLLTSLERERENGYMCTVLNLEGAPHSGTPGTVANH